MNRFYFVKSGNVEKSLGVVLNDGIAALLVDSKAVCCERHFEAASELAKLAFESGDNISRSMQNEILLFLACETHVRNAIAKVGARNGMPAILAFFGKEKNEMEKTGLLKFGLEKIDLDFGKYNGRKLKEKIEKMALSRIN